MSEQGFLRAGGASERPHVRVALVIQTLDELEAVLVSLLLILLAGDDLADSEHPLESLRLERVVQLQEGLQRGQVVLDVVVVGSVDRLDEHLGDFLTQLGVFVAHIGEALSELLATRLVAQKDLEELGVEEHLLLEVGEGELVQERLVGEDLGEHLDQRGEVGLTEGPAHLDPLLAWHAQRRLLAEDEVAHSLHELHIHEEL